MSITATGQASFGGGTTGPDGGPWQDADFSAQAIYTNAELVSLIGKIGGTTLVGTGTPVPSGRTGQGAGFVGSSYNKIMQQSGRLFLTYNDQIWFSDNSAILIRPSGTEPVFRLYAEAKNQEKALKLVEDYSSRLKKILETI